MPCCPVLLSLYCIVIVSLNEINGDEDGDNLQSHLNYFSLKINVIYSSSI